MKYIKKFEKETKDENEFTKYEGKFIIFNYSDRIHEMGVFHGVDYYHDDFVNITIYRKYDEDNYSRTTSHISIRSFKIIDSFDTLKKCEEMYNIIKQTEKYNL